VANQLMMPTRVHAAQVPLGLQASAVGLTCHLDDVTRHQVTGWYLSDPAPTHHGSVCRLHAAAQWQAYSVLVT
jgi:hypothetical protein